MHKQHQDLETYPPKQVPLQYREKRMSIQLDLSELRVKKEIRGNTSTDKFYELLILVGLSSWASTGTYLEGEKIFLLGKVSNDWHQV